VIPIAIRLGRPSDLAYVVDTWTKRGHERGERLREATARVRAILARPDSVLRVATLPDDSDAILGWAVVASATLSDAEISLPKLHYVYVRKEARQQGIARRLLVGVDWPKSEKPGK
jgi:ribosomal protein S18 acetylase RimI-like enzyme